MYKIERLLKRIHFLLSLLVFLCHPSLVHGQQGVNIERIEELVAKWAPLVWMSPEEKFFPSDVEYFLNKIHVENEDGQIKYPSFDNSLLKIETRKLYLVTNENIDSLKQNDNSFLYGKNPQIFRVPIYALVSLCSSRKSLLSPNNKNNTTILSEKTENPQFFHVTYWIFHPYNQGKEVCFLGKVPSIQIFGRCLGHFKTLGNHVGDWERMSLTFKGSSNPSGLYLSAHNSGSYFKFDPNKNIFVINTSKNKDTSPDGTKLAPIIHLQNGHPVVFSADGSHGLWAAPGDHQYAKIPRLIDSCGYGIPWKTWRDLKIFIKDVPDWASFKGKWGNPKSECVLFRKFGLCGHTDGPPGILRTKNDFYC